MVLATLVGACASPGHLPRQRFAPAPIDDSTVVTGRLRWVFETGDEWLRVRVANSGGAPVVLSWDAAQWVTSGGAMHRVVEASLVRDFVAAHHVALAVEAQLPLTAAEAAMLFRGGLPVRSSIGSRRASGGANLTPRLGRDGRVDPLSRGAHRGQRLR